MGSLPLLIPQIVSAWAQTWHIISTCHLQSNAQKKLGLDSGNLFRYQFSPFQNHHCPAPVSMSTWHQKWQHLTTVQALLVLANETGILSARSMSTIRNCKGLRTYFFASCCACSWERHNSSTKIKFWTSSPPSQNVSSCALIHELLHAYCFTDQWAVMHLVHYEITVLRKKPNLRLNMWSADKSN